MNFIVNLKQISINDIKNVGGKGASLGEMLQAGIPVPPGFVITTETFKEFSNLELPADVKEQILRTFDELNTESVAVRSSAVAEDSGTASWAGQLESYLHTTRENLIGRIRDCWNSIKNERALAYAAQNDIPEEELAVAVVVQKMVNSESAGVLFTVNPITNNRDEIMIEACYGLGELLVQGMVTPDNYLIDKSTGDIKEKSLNSQTVKLIFKKGQNTEVQTTDQEKGQQVLTEKQIQSLTDLGNKIEKHYGTPQDIEFAIEESEVYIVQSRPITTLFSRNS